MSFVKIPGFDRYLISQNGTILDTVAEEIIQTQEDLTIYSKVRLLYKNRTNRYRTVPVAKLILLAHVRVDNITLDTVWGAKLRDPNKLQVTVNNLQYDMGDYNPPVPDNPDEFFPVPGFIETEINLNGCIRMSGKDVKVGEQRGYAVASARLPNGESVTVGRHRLMALTFLRHPIICSDLIVNHKNGKPAEDKIDNLEWVTYKGNIIHAHATNLVGNHIPVEVKSLLTGDIEKFFSIGEVSRRYALNLREAKRLEFRIRTFGAISNFRGLAIRKKSCVTSWEDLYTIDKYKGNAKEVVVRDVLTNKATTFIWFKDAADFLNVTQYRLRTALRKYGVVRIGDYEVFYNEPTILDGNESSLGN